MKMRIFVLGAGVLSLVGSLALAGGWARGTGFGRYGALGLSEDQARKMEEVAAGCRSEMAPAQEELFAKRQELRALWQSPELDQTAIAAKQAEMRDLQAKLQEARLR